MKLYASELMELARKEPEKYEGKRYKVLGLCCIGPERQCYGEVIVDSEGRLQGKGYDNWAYINSNTKLEEIKPQPQPVPFMEAVKAMKQGKFACCSCDGETKVYGGLSFTTSSGYEAVTTNEILYGVWTIKE